MRVSVYQPADTLITVSNFIGTGTTIEINLYGSRRAAIASQYLYSSSANSVDVYTYSANFYDDYSMLKSFYQVIICDKAADLRTITWGNWTLMGGSYYFLVGLDGTIETDFDLTYPEASTFPLQGDGTAESPYIINSAAEWHAVADYMASDYETFTGSYLKLASDIDFTETGVKPLGYDGYVVFDGNLDGNGKMLKWETAVASGKYYGAIVMATALNANLHDFTITGSLTSDYDYTGGVVGSLYGKVSGIESGINLISTSTFYVGGIVGYCYRGTITDCVFSGEITSTTSYVGGIVGSTSYNTISGCINRGVITSSRKNVGGIVGHTYFNTSVTCCTNEGTVSSSSTYPGGISGYVYYYCTLTDCHNCGTVNGGESNGAGGIAGEVDTHSSIIGCSNRGVVSGQGYYVGGVVGSLRNSTISDCSNDSVVSSSSYYCSGVVGYSYSTSQVDNCVNRGTVTSSSHYVGGVVGLSNNSVVSTCVNQGTVASLSSDAEFAGGVVGRAYNGTTLDSCFNEGIITSAAVCTGGVVGYAYSNVTLTQCANRGTVSTTNYNTGGVAGQTYKSTLKDCFNEGVVTSTAKQIAGVTGASYLACTHESCYNTGTVVCTGDISSSYASGVVCVGYYGEYNGCYNAGTVEATNSQAGCLSGVICYLYGTSTSYTFTITDCYNTADITGYFNVAGLVCYGTSSAIVDADGCYNTGDITSTYTTDSAYPTAGLFSSFFCQSSYKNCYNAGCITSKGTSYTAGLFGLRAALPTTTSTIEISNCHNSGDVKSSSEYTGGIIACEVVYTNIDSCYNTGDITSSASYTGGISGYSSTACNTNNSWNVGNITSNDAYTGGIAGRGAGTFHNVYNAGEVAGTEYVGGLVGLTSAGNFDISTGYSTGIITAVGACGNILGIDVSNTKQWNSGNSIANTYYLEDNGVLGSDTLSTALSYAQLGALEIDGWIAGDSCTYPILADNDYARTYAAAVIPANGDSYSSITQGFSVGTPDGVTWTASSGSVEIDGNNVTFSENFSGTLTMTARCGDSTATTSLNCNVTSDGIDKRANDTRQIVDEVFYLSSGLRVGTPSNDTKGIYIVVRTYDDGAVTVTKEIY